MSRRFSPSKVSIDVNNAATHAANQGKIERFRRKEEQNCKGKIPFMLDNRTIVMIEPGTEEQARQKYAKNLYGNMGGPLTLKSKHPFHSKGKV